MPEIVTMSRVRPCIARTSTTKAVTSTTTIVATITVDDLVRASVPTATTTQAVFQIGEPLRAISRTTKRISPSRAIIASRFALPTMPWMRPPSKSRLRDQ